MVSIAVHPKKAERPIIFNDCGKVSSFKFLHPSNAYSPIVVTPFLNITLETPEDVNACFVILEVPTDISAIFAAINASPCIVSTRSGIYRYGHATIKNAS